MKPLKIVGIAGVALLAALLWWQKQPVQSAGEPKAHKAAEAPVAVRLIPVIREKLSRTVRATGTLAADEAVTAAFKVDGRLSENPPDLGAKVEKGQRLAALDDADFALQVRQAQAAVAQMRAQLGLAAEGDDDAVNPEDVPLVREAKANADNAALNRERVRSLAEKGYAARAEVDDLHSQALVAESRYQSALQEVRNRQALLVERRLALALARSQLANAVLYAPLEGRVLERKAAVGEYLTAGTPVVVIVRLHPLRLRLAVPERDAASLRVGQAVSVAVEGDTARHAGRIARISPSIVEQNRTLVVEAEIANPDGRLRPGAFAQAEIALEGGQEALTVPAAALVTFAGIEKALTVKDGKAVEARVRTGRRAGDRVEVLEGLSAGDRIVAEPGNLAGGRAVRVEN